MQQVGSKGANVSIHDTVQFFNPANVFIGDNVRIDCFCVLSAGTEGIHIGNNVHIAAGVYVFGGGGKVEIEDFAGISSRVSLYTASDDYSGGHMTNPTVPDRYRQVRRGGITLRKHAILGAGTVVMPGVELGLGASVGALSFVNKNVKEFLVVSGNPLRLVGTRNRRVLELEKEYLDEAQQG
jgi:acetyltransferase-like isoleucine patch superfamily enzyme